MSDTESQSGQLARTALYDLHLEAGARMVPFAGFEMPVQYTGIKAEHLHTREAAGLFDVSHMGQILVSGPEAAAELEQLIPANLDKLAIGQQRYSFFTLNNGGLLDDLIIARRADDVFYLVVNASRIAEDLAHLQQHLKCSIIEVLDKHALLALQGPQAAVALASCFVEIKPAIEQLSFMNCMPLSIKLGDDNVELVVCRSGYTGEDGFEISIPSASAPIFARQLLEHLAITWVGLGARDSLRLDAGLCLYGHDINDETSPIEAGLTWCIDKDRRQSGERPGGFLGADIIFSQLERGVSRRRKGFVVDGKTPVREGAEIVDAQGKVCGRVTSGGFSPSLNKPVLMAYVDSAVLNSQVPLHAIVRGKKIAILQTDLPFVKKGS